MSQTLQLIFVGLIVGGCVAYVAWQIVGTLNLRKSRAGKCCSTGCDAGPNRRQPSASGAKSEQFIPADALRK